ncbi:MAG: DUF4339 domain-containing protein [Opitutales bacterium]|jgi:hypothetical protein|nr:MAG: DUF4339 domain-containing protein [Opitutales bacterium]
MSSELIHIARAGVEIGAWALDEVRAKMASGELLRSDNYWKPGMAGWLTLAVLPDSVRVLPFPRPAEKGANLLDGMLGRQSYQAGLLAVWDKLSKMPAQCLISDDDWLLLGEKLGYDVRKRCRDDLIKWYRQAFEAYLSDRYFDALEKADLGSLARSFGLDAPAAEALHGEAFARYCRIGMLTVLLRDIPPQQKREQIDLLGKEVPLSDVKIKETMGEAFRSYFDQHLKTLMQQEDGGEVMDPAAFAAFMDVIKQMDINLHLDEESQTRIESAQRLWALCRSPLREVPCELDLGREGCFWTQQVELGLNKQVTTRRSYGGFGTSIKIWGPLRYRAGSYDVERQTERRLVKVDTGTLVFTSKRVIFTGSLKSFNFKLTKVLDVTVYTDALEVDRDTGGDVIFFFPSGQTEAAVILRRLVRQAKD